MAIEALTRYLVSYGAAGEIGLFGPAEAGSYRRGDRVVVRGRHGLECGVVLCRGTEGHDRFLSRTPGGEIVRRLDDRDRADAKRRLGQAQDLFLEARSLVAELGHPLEILDVSVSLDGATAFLYHLLRIDCDYRPVVSALSRQFDLAIVMENLASPTAEAGCGRPGCGQGQSGGCGSCGTGGCGLSCGKGEAKDDVGALLANFQPTQPAAHSNRIGLV